MLSTRFGWYVNIRTGKTSLRTLNYSLPEDLHQHINFLSPMTKFRPTFNRDQSSLAKWRNIPTAWVPKHEQRDATTTVPSDSSCERRLIPQCIPKLYNIHYGPPSSTSNINKLSFAEFDQEFARYSDLARYEKAAIPYAKGQKLQRNINQWRAK